MVTSSSAAGAHPKVPKPPHCAPARARNCLRWNVTVFAACSDSLDRQHFRLGQQPDRLQCLSNLLEALVGGLSRRRPDHGRL